MTLAASLCCIAIASAQDAETDRNQVYHIGLGNVQYAHHDEKMSTGEAVGKILSGIATGHTSVQATKYEADVLSAIARGLSGSYRFRYNDKAAQMSETLEEGDIKVDALIMNIQAQSSSRTWKDKDDKTQVTTWYTGIVDVMLTLKDAKTGEVITNSTISGRGSSSSTYSTSDQAIRGALDGLSGRITAWLNKYKPLQANLLEGASAKKDKQKEVYIDLGSREGAFRGLHMGVFIVKTIAGKEAHQQIGKLKVEAVEGEDISRCKVQSGGKEIKAAIDAGGQLKVISID